jgi:hypothetical protein
MSSEDAVAVCDNCRLYCNVSDLDPIADLEQRLDAGGIVPAGQCPHCGALSYLQEGERNGR